MPEDILVRNAKHLPCLALWKSLSWALRISDMIKCSDLTKPLRIRKTGTNIEVNEDSTGGQTRGAMFDPAEMIRRTHYNFLHPREQEVLRDCPPEGSLQRSGFLAVKTDGCAYVGIDRRDGTLSNWKLVYGIPLV